MRFKHIFGDKKTKTKFLWFPTTLNDETRWLEIATIEYKYVGWEYTTNLSPWKKIRFVWGAPT